MRDTFVLLASGCGAGVPASAFGWPAELDDAEWHREALPYVQHIAESGRYPHFTRMIAEAEKFPDPDATFEWQLQRVLDGLAHAIPASLAGEERAEE